MDIKGKVVESLEQTEDGIIKIYFTDDSYLEIFINDDDELDAGLFIPEN